MTPSNPSAGHDAALPREPVPKSLSELATEAVNLGGLIDGAWVLCEDDSRQARNATLPLLEAAKRMADDLVRELEQRHQAPQEAHREGREA